MKSYVYILLDDKGRFYIGSTNNLERRLKQHSLGHTQTTRNMSNPRLALSQEVSSLAIARKIETRLKRMKRKDYIERIVSDGYIKIAVS